MSRCPKRQWQTMARLVSPETAEVVFNDWADSFEVESGWSLPGINRRRRAELRFSRSAGAYVYFAVAPAGPIKIGLSKQPLLRVRSFPGYEILVAVSEQDTRGEWNIHDQLIDFRRPHGERTYLHGVKHEWFRRDPLLVSLIYRLINASVSQLSLAAASAA